MDLFKRKKELEEKMVQLSQDYTGLQGQLQQKANELMKLQGALEENSRQIAEHETEDEIPLSPPLQKGEEHTPPADAGTPLDRGEE